MPTLVGPRCPRIFFFALIGGASRGGLFVVAAAMAGRGILPLARPN